MFNTYSVNSERENPSRHWVFTLNNPLPNEEKGAWLPDCEYWCIGEEVGENGTPHLQGYCVFMDRYRLKQITDHHPTAKRCHWEVQVEFSTPKQASDYCKKDGKFLEMGEWYLHVHDITDPEFADCMSSSDSDSSAPDYEHEELDEDYIAPNRSDLKSIASPHFQSCDAQRDT